MSNEIEMKDDELRITRVFDAPREKVFEAWTRPELVERWWGCAMTEAVSSTIDLRVGGKYKHRMTIRDVGVHDFDAVITELEIPARLAYAFTFENPMGGDSVEATVTVLFHEEGDRTRVELTHKGFPVSDFRPIVSEGWGAAFDKLAKRLVPTPA